MDRAFEEKNIPTILVIFGATGDLSRRKLLPALFDLHESDLLPDMTRIVGVARRGLSDDDYRMFAKQQIEKYRGKKYDKNDMEVFLNRLVYHSGDFSTPENYKKLSERLISIEDSFGACSNKLFYLSVSPSYYNVIFKELANSGLTIPCSSKDGWTRVLVEKPFGEDIKTAKELDKMLGLLFKEEQIFRIDHYLGKETLQDILMFRFSNLIFEPIWNNKYIEKVELILNEDIDIEGRGSFYDKIGALRDVGQNHILQMLAFVAMDNPKEFTSEAIRKNRASVVEKLQKISKHNLREHVLRAQYSGYKNEEGVSPDSKTETYFKIKTFINNERWRGVPFVLESGKALSEKRAEINVHFKKTEDCLCPKGAEKHHSNVLTFRIQPNAGISILFWVKKPGVEMQLEPKKLSFSYNDEDSKRITAYERILFDAIIGDQTSFTSTKEVSAAWEFITPILENWEDLELHEYEKGASMADTQL